MPRFALTLLVLALFSFPASVSAIAASPRRISLDDAIAIALRENRTLKAAGLESDAARAQVGVARGALIPRLDADENLSYTNNPVQVFSDLLMQQDFSGSDFGLNQLNHPGFLSNFQSQVRLSFPLFAGGRLIAAYRAAGFAADAEQWQVIQTRQKVEFAVVRSYYQAMLAEQALLVIERAQVAAHAHLARAKDRFAHGSAISSDVLRTNVLVGTIEQQRIEANSQLHIARARLAHTLGDEDERLAPLERPAALAVAIPGPGPLDPLIARAITDRPEMMVASARVKQARQAVTIARADYLPTVEIAGVYENDSESFARAGNNGALLVTGRLNLFNGLATQSKLEAARSDLSRAQVLADDLRHSVALEVETAYRGLTAARQSLEVARRNRAYAESALKVLADRYDFGLASNVAVLDAQTVREETDMRLATARVSVAVDRAALNLAVGLEPQPASGH
ncbi:MAG TPA: TolC family protein [Candidatus Binataceae bacterium]|nr:TolC family protein [Candidatus Binataceae bacterium]